MYARTLDHDDLQFSASTIMADLKTVSTNQFHSKFESTRAMVFKIFPTPSYFGRYHKAVSLIKTIMA